MTDRTIAAIRDPRVVVVSGPAPAVAAWHGLYLNAECARAAATTTGQLVAATTIGQPDYSHVSFTVDDLITLEREARTYDRGFHATFWRLWVAARALSVLPDHAAAKVADEVRAFVDYCPTYWSLGEGIAPLLKRHHAHVAQTSAVMLLKVNEVLATTGYTVTIVLDGLETGFDKMATRPASARRTRFVRGILQVLRDDFGHLDVIRIKVFMPATLAYSVEVENVAHVLDGRGVTVGRGLLFGNLA